MQTEGRKKAVAKYQAKLDSIKVWIPKGEREKYKMHAERCGKSLNALIVELLDSDIARSKEAEQNANNQR
ncbi:hypothetical protein [Ruminococcus champanellensis]|jgi:hypothetical protein|uniref:Arc-like DNA binding domain-containing protein n=1 Tax=Ruminococcus champanellensis (strain DSM 18848 / JCM 17042 / KCTC 15320 / 18P13) TaxID=213810 RepID=D4LDX9_RUMC1|nr:hypothetical protein [Ruminococcus champanellensis]CBL17824.1 hypothetical protein RUM_17600 [Ruminococcus champanellensis 18P13 = JCM 17042]